MFNPFKRHDRTQPLPQFDGDAELLRSHPLAKHLPPAALLRYDEISSEAERLNGPLREIGQQVRAMREQASLKESQADAWKFEAARGYTQAEIGIELEKRAKEIAALRAKAKKLDAHRDEQGAVWSRLQTLVGNIERYAKQIEVMPAMHGKSVMPAGDPIRAIEKAKAKISALKLDRDAIDATPWPSSVVKAKAIAEIAEAAARGRPNVFSAIEQNADIAWPTASIEHVAYGTNYRSDINGIDAFALIAWLHHDHLVEKTCAEIDARSDDGVALTQRDRDTRHAEVADRLLSAERELEAAILAAGFSGSAYRDADQDPRAVLNLADTAPAPRAPRL